MPTPLRPNPLIWTQRGNFIYYLPGHPLSLSPPFQVHPLVIRSGWLKKGIFLLLLLVQVGNAKTWQTSLCWPSTGLVQLVLDFMTPVGEEWIFYLARFGSRAVSLICVAGDGIFVRAWSLTERIVLLRSAGVPFR